MARNPSAVVIAHAQPMKKKPEANTYLRRAVPQFLSYDRGRYGAHLWERRLVFLPHFISAATALFLGSRSCGSVSADAIGASIESSADCTW
jgi:hypothetical protein